MAIVSVVLTVATFAAYILRDLTGDGYLLDEPVDLLSIIVGFLVLTLVLLGWPTARVVAKQFSGLVVLAVVGFTFVTVDLFTTGEGLFGARRRERDSLGGGHILVGATPHWPSRDRPPDRGSGHPIHASLLSSRLALQVTTIGALVLALAYVLYIVSAEDMFAVLIISIVLAVCAALDLFAASLLAGSTLNRLTFVSLAATPVVIGIIVIAVLHSSDLGVLLTPQSASVLLALPVLALCALTIPATIRRTYGPLLPERQPPPAGPGAQWQQPGHPTQPPPTQPPPYQPPRRRPCDRRHADLRSRQRYAVIVPLMSVNTTPSRVDR